MRHIGRILAAAVVTFALAKAADACPLNSVFLFSLGTDQLSCSAVNVVATPITMVTVELLDQSGTIVATNACSSLPPNAVCSVVSPAGADARCRVTSSAHNKRIRALLELQDSGGNTKVAIPIN